MPELDTSHVEWCPRELAGGLLIGRERAEGLPINEPATKPGAGRPVDVGVRSSDP